MKISRSHALAVDWPGMKLSGTEATPQIPLPSPLSLHSQFPPPIFRSNSNRRQPTMTSLHASLPSLSSLRSRRSPPNAGASSTLFSTLPYTARRGRRRHLCRAMVQQAAQGAPAIYAKEMERLSAKESLLLAFKDSGGFEALVTGKTTDMQRIDVNERIIGLERLNPTPRPTTSPFLEGKWNFEWFGSGSPGLAATLIFQRFPSTLANLSKLDAVIKDGTAKITANVKLLNSIVESKIILSSKLSVEGPLRLKEEYVEGILETPSVIEEAVPEQLKGAYNQAVNTMQQLPVPIKDIVASGLRVPLNGSYQRLLMISYLDEEILIVRDTAGVPEVLTRLDSPPSPLEPNATDYES